MDEDVSLARLSDALEGFSGRYGIETLTSILETVRRTTGEERTILAREMLRMAMKSDPEVFQVALDAMSLEVILPADQEERCMLYYALAADSRMAVMAVVERMKREEHKQERWVVDTLFTSDLLLDEDVVDAVVSVLPRATFGACGPSMFYDSLDDALRCWRVEHRERAVEMVLKLGPPMEERLEGWKRFHYVYVAAMHCGVQLVQRMHDLLPLLADGSGRRGQDEEYAEGIRRAFENMTGADVSDIVQYLVEEGEDQVLDICDPKTVLRMPTEEGVAWLVTRAPHLLQRACGESKALDIMIGQEETMPFLMEQLVEYVEAEDIVQLMRLRLNDCLRESMAEEGWRWRLKRLHKAVPECMDGLRWPWLMEAVGDRAYIDVEYMLGMCTREHLVMRNEEGDTAYDVAAKDGEFPQDLLARLKVVTKGAHA